MNKNFIMTTGTIKTMEAFAEVVKGIMESYFGEGYRVEIHKVLKNNDLQLTGLVILDNVVNMFPTIYLECYFQEYCNGKDMRDICKEIVEIYNQHRLSKGVDVSFIKDFSKVMNNVCFKLVNKEQNADLLKDVPHTEFNDLAIVYYMLASVKDGELGTMLIKNALLDMWNIDKYTLHKVAMKNTQIMLRGSITPIDSVIGDIISRLDDEEFKNQYFDMMADADLDIPLYVCTNSRHLNGAGVILYDGLLKEFADTIKEDFYILPCSVHETMFVPASFAMDEDELRAMVTGINAQEVEYDEVLSNNVYRYNRLYDRVEIV